MRGRRRNDRGKVGRRVGRRVGYRVGRRIDYRVDRRVGRKVGREADRRVITIVITTSQIAKEKETATLNAFYNSATISRRAIRGSRRAPILRYIRDTT